MTRFTPAHRGGSGPPLVCLHGFVDTWRTWELVLPALEPGQDVLTVTLAGHAGGPPIEGELDEATLADAVERAMDAAGFGTAHLAGNSLGGFVALQLAERGRARSVVALAPAGGWTPGDESYGRLIAVQRSLVPATRVVAPHADALLATPGGPRTACCRGRQRPRATASSGCRTPIGSCSTGSATARSWTCRRRPPRAFFGFQ